MEKGDIHKYINNSRRDDKENRVILLYFHLINDWANLQEEGRKAIAGSPVKFALLYMFDAPGGILQMMGSIGDIPLGKYLTGQVLVKSSILIARCVR